MYSVPLYYIVPMILGPVGGLAIAWLNMRASRASTKLQEMSTTIQNLRTDLADARAERDVSRSRLRLARDCFIQMLDPIEGLEQEDHQRVLRDLVRQALKEI